MSAETLKWHDNKATAKDGTEWTIEPYPGYDGSPNSVVLTSHGQVVAGGILTSMHRNSSDAKHWANTYQNRGF